MQLIKDGEVDMASIWNGRASTLKEEGAPISFSYEQGVLNADCMVIPKGLKNKDLAMKALASFLSPRPPGQPAALYRQRAGEPEGLRHRQDSGRQGGPGINSAPENAKKQVLLDPGFWADTLVEAQEKFDNLIQQ